jgi:hypothetical protein
MDVARILIFAALAIAVLTFIVTEIRFRWKVWPFRTIQSQIRSMVRAGTAKVGREQDDLLIEGNFSGIPAPIRLSRSDNKPGLNISAPFPASLSISCVPRDSEGLPLASSVRTGDSYLDSQFKITTDQPMVARLLLVTSGGVPHLRKLCCSSSSFIVISNRSMETRELLIPSQNVAHHILDHLSDIAHFVRVASRLPGAGDNAPIPYKRRRWLTLAPYGLSVMLLLVALLSFVRHRQAASKAANAPRTETATLPADISKIDGIQNWQLLQTGDFDSHANDWLQQQGIAPKTHFAAADSGNELKQSIYLLKQASTNMRRILILLSGEVRYDTTMQSLAAAARVPRTALRRITWSGRDPSKPPTGDGILVIRSYQDPASGIVLFPSGNQIELGTPRDFHAIDLQ